MNRILALGLCSAAVLLPSAASAQRYMVASSPSTFEPIPIADGDTPVALTFAGGTVHTSGYRKNAYVTIQLPFDFTFFGNTYDEMHVSTNGLVSFGAVPTNLATNNNLNNATAPNNVIAVWWDENGCLDGGVQTQLIPGADPGDPQRFVVEWNCSTPYNNTTTATFTPFQAQLWLTEGSTDIFMRYGPAITYNSLQSASVGIKDSTGATRLVVNLPNPANGTTCTTNCNANHWPAETEYRLWLSERSELKPLNITTSDRASTASDLSFTLQATIRNDGLADAVNLPYRLYASRDRNVDAGDFVIYDGTVALVSGLTELPFSDSVTGMKPPAGEYYICIALDPDSVVPEYDKTDNTVCTTGTAYKIGAQLAISTGAAGFGGTTETQSGDRATYNIRIENQGTDAIPSFVYRINFTTTNPASDGVVVEEIVPSLGPAGSADSSHIFAATHPVWVPSFPAGVTTFTARLTIDVNDDVAEINEAASVHTRTLTVNLVQGELFFDGELAISYPANALGCFYDEPVTVTYQVCNTGKANAYNFTNGIVIGDNSSVRWPQPSDRNFFIVDALPPQCELPAGAEGPVPDSTCSYQGNPGYCYLESCHITCQVDSDCPTGLSCVEDRQVRELGRTCQNYLARGDVTRQCKTYTRTFTMPSVNPRTNEPLVTPEGGFYVAAFIDPDGYVPDNNRSNNRKLAPETIMCRERGPDPAAVSVTAPARMAAGETVVIARTIANRGNVDATFSYRYVLSTNPTVSINDLVLPVEGVSGDPSITVAREGEHSGTDVVRVPSHLAAGTYYIGLLVDPGSTITELDESNNQVAGLVAVRVDAATLRIVTTHLPDGTVGAVYNRQLVATGGAGTYQWSADPSALPPGLTLSSGGLLSGVPTDDGTWAFQVTVSSGGASTVGMLAIRINVPMGALTVSTTELPTAVYNQPYTGRIAASGGAPPYACELVTGAGAPTPPRTLAVNSDCTVVGTPIEVTDGVKSFGVRVRDQMGNVAQGTVGIRVVRENDLFIRTEFDEAFAGEIYGDCNESGEVACLCLEAQGGDGTYTWSFDPSTLPAGLSGGADGCLYGSPTACDTFVVSARVESAGQSDMRNLPLVVTCQRIGLKTRFLDDVKPGDSVSVQLEADTNEEVTFRLFAGDLPAGLELSSSGFLSGTVAIDAAARTYNFVVELKDAKGNHGYDALAITVLATPREAPPPQKKDDGGCSTASDGASGFLPFGIALLGLVAAGFRRRAAAAVPVAE